MGCKLALSPGMSATNGQVALAVLPSQPVPAVLFHPTLLVVILLVVILLLLLGLIELIGRPPAAAAEPETAGQT